MRVYYSATVALVASLSSPRFSSGFAPPSSSLRSCAGGWVVDAGLEEDDAHAVRRRRRISRRLPLPGIIRGDRHHLVLLRSTSTEGGTETSSPSSPSSPSTTNESQKKKKKKKGKKKRLGLVTFDLDDTLYPIAPVLDEANAAFSAAMSNFGYVDIRPSDIVETGKEIRANLATGGDDNDASSSSSSSSSSSPAGVPDPLRPRTVNHKEIRMAAIRKEMERFILNTKLRQTAADWATCVKTRRSFGGAVIRLAGGTIAYKTKFQPTVAGSSTEAEFMAA